MKKGTFCCLAVPVLLASATFFASDSWAERTESEDCIRQKVWDSYPEGWAVRTITNVELAESEHHIYVMTFYAGNEYKIMGCGDSAIANLDLVLYDANGVLQIQDPTSDRQPQVTYKPTTTDTYYLSVQATARTEKGKAVPGTKSAVSVAVTYK